MSGYMQPYVFVVDDGGVGLEAVSRAAVGTR